MKLVQAAPLTSHPTFIPGIDPTLNAANGPVQFTNTPSSVTFDPNNPFATPLTFGTGGATNPAPLPASQSDVTAANSGGLDFSISNETPTTNATLPTSTDTQSLFGNAGMTGPLWDSQTPFVSGSDGFSSGLTAPSGTGAGDGLSLSPDFQSTASVDGVPNINPANALNPGSLQGVTDFWTKLFTKIENVGARFGLILLGVIIIGVGAYAATQGEFGNGLQKLAKGAA